MKKELKKYGNNTNRVNTLIKIAYTYDFEPPAMKKYCEAALKLSRKLNYKLGESIALQYLAIYYWKTSHYSSSLDYYFRTLKINHELGNKLWIARAFIGYRHCLLFSI